jgi:hypothetical protein
VPDLIAPPISEMNSTLHGDRLEPTHAPLACHPNGGDPDYAFVCWYTLDIVASGYILLAAWLFRSAHRKFRLDSDTTRTKPVAQSSATARSSMLMHARQGKDQIKRLCEFSHLVQFALTLGTAVLFGGLALIVNGAGTKYGLDEFRGQLGDTFCKSELIYMIEGVACDTHELPVGSVKTV